MSALLKNIARTGLKKAARWASTGQWVFLAVDTEPHYIDTLALAPGTAAVWKYRAIYLNGDEQFGQWSDPVSIAVQG